MKQFDACSLCLQRARDPVACQEGHLFCKECAYNDLRAFLFPTRSFRKLKYPVTQKKDIKKQKERLEAMKRDAEEEKARAKAAARERVLAEFERSHIGLAATSTVSTSARDSDERAPISSTSLSYPMLTKP